MSRLKTSSSSTTATSASSSSASSSASASASASVSSSPPEAILISNATTSNIQPRIVDAVPIGSELRNDVGICRGCGQNFIRPPGCHDAQAQYFRCKECCKLKVIDFCSLS